MSLYDSINEKIKENNTKNTKSFIRNQKKISIMTTVLYGLLIVSDCGYLIKEYVVGIVPVTIYTMIAAIVLETLFLILTLFRGMTKGNVVYRTINFVAFSLPLIGYVPLMAYADGPSIFFFIFRFFICIGIGYILFTKQSIRTKAVRLVESITLIASSVFVVLAVTMTLTLENKRRVTYSYDHTLDGYVVKDVFKGLAPVKFKKNTVMLADESLKNAGEELTLPESVVYISENAFFESNVKTLNVSGSEIKMMDAIDNSGVETINLLSEGTVIDMENSSSNQVVFVSDRTIVDAYRSQYRDYDYMFIPEVNEDEMYILFNGTDLPVVISKKGEDYTVDNPYDEELTSKTDDAGNEYLFQGWYSSDDTEISFPFVTVASVSVSAKWSRVYDVTLIADGGTTLDGEEIEDTLRYHSELGTYTLPELTKANYKFCGWYDLEDSETRITEIDESLSKDLNLKAKFLKICGITYELNGGTLEDMTTEYTSEDSVTLNTPSKTGYTFLGWYDSAGTEITGLGDGKATDITLTAKWQLEAPVLTVSSDIDKDFDNQDSTVSVTASHALENVKYSYTWYIENTTSVYKTGSSFDARNFDDSGKYYCVVTATLDGEEAKATSPVVSVSIHKLTYDMSGISFTDASLTYNGMSQHQEVSGTLPSGIDGLQILVSYVGGATNVEDGKQPVTAVFTSVSSNYKNPESMKAYVTIVPLELSVSWDSDSLLFPYDGQVHNAVAILEGVLDGDTVSVTVSGESNSIGTHTATTGKLSNTNYCLNKTYTQDYEILKGDYKISDYVTVEDATYTYDGEAHYPKISGKIPSGVTPKYSDSVTDAGSKVITVSFIYDNATYTISETMDATVTVTQKEIGVSLSYTDTTYNGTVQKPELSITNLVEGDSCTADVSSEESINAGDYALILTGLSNSNYKLPDQVSYSYTIKKASYDMSGVKFTGVQKVYDGTFHAPELSGTLPIGLDGTQVVASIGEGLKNVGSKTVYVTFAGSSNYNTPVSLSANVTITPREAVVEASFTSVVYNGTDQKPSLTITNLVSGDSCNINTSSSASINAGSYVITVNSLSNGNYKLSSSNEFVYTIEKATYDMSGITFSDAAYVYDGTAHKPVISGTLPTGADQTQVSASYSEGIKNVGSSTVTVTFTGTENYNTPESMSATVTITPKTIELTWGDATHTYSGTAWAPSATASGLVGTDECTVTVSGAQVNAGSYTATATQLSNSNYELPSEVTKSYTITKASMSVTPVITNTSVTYDGKTHTPAVSGLAEGITAEYSQEPKDAGEYTVVISYAYENENYEITQEDSITFTVLPLEAALSWDYSSITYDGNANCPLAHVSNLIGEDTCDVMLEDSNTVSVGTYTAEATELSNSNYKLPSDATHSYTIDPADYDMSGISFTDVTFEYDGTAHKPVLNGTLPTGIDLTQVTASIGEGLTNVGSKQVTVSFTGSPNYNTPASMTARVTITAKAVTVSWVSVTHVYTGTSWTPSATAVGLVNADTCTVTVNGANTNVGTYTATATQLSNSNYTLSGDLSTSYTITKAELSITPEFVVSFTYDGKDHTPVVSGLPSGVTASFDSSIKNVGSQIITVSYACDDENYEITRTDKETVTITAKTALLSWSYDSVVYDGNAQTPIATVSNLETGDSCTVTLRDASNSNVGSYTAVAIGLSNSNYVLDDTEHAYEITKATYDMSGITFRNTVADYDGTAHTPTLDGTLPTGADGTVVTVSYDKTVKDVSTVTVTATFKGSFNYNDIPSMTATMTVNAKVIGLSWGTLSHEYDASSWAPSASATGLVGSDICTVTVSGANTDAGTYTAKAVSLSNSNYRLPTNVTASYTITKAELEFTPVFTATFEYDGTAHTPVATSLPDGVTPSYSTSLTNAGSTEVTVSYSYNSKNYKIDNTTSLTLTVTKKEVTISQSYTSTVYNGEKQAPVLTAEGLITGDECSVTVGTSSNITAGSYTIEAAGLSNENYSLPETKTFSYTIARADYDMSGVSFDARSITYDTVSHGIAVTGTLPTGKDDIQVTAAYTTANVQDAGTYEITASFTTASTNYNTPASMTAVITVEQAPVQINWDQSTLVFTYDGATHVPTATVTGVLGSDACNVTITGASNTAGSHTATASIDNANYYISSGETQTYAITEGEFDVTQLVTFSDTTKEYNGTEQRPTLSGTLPSYVVVEYSEGRTEVGETIVTATFSSNDSNYTVSGSLTAKITIVAKELTVTWSNASFTYDGYSHAPVPTITGYLGDDSSDYSVTDGQVNAGTYTASISALLNSNYKLPSNSSCEYTIAKASYDMSGISYNNISVEYDGKTHAPVISGSLPVGLDSIQPSVSYSGSLTNAGSLEVTATFTTASDNYNAPSSMKAVVTITKKTVGLSWSNLEFTYTGAVYHPSVTVTGTISGDEVTATMIGAATDAGTYTAEVTALSNSNYALPSVTTKSYTIAKATYDMSGITFADVSCEYDGEYHTPAVSGELPEGVSVSYTAGLTHAGEVTVTASFTGSSNYNAIADMTANLTVSKKQISLTWENTSFSYDGETHTPTYTLSGVVEGDTVTVTFTGASSEVGTHTASITGLGNEDYYLDSTASQEYVISMGSYDMSGISFEDASYTYDGKSHSIQVTGTLPTGGDGIQIKVSYTGSATYVSDGSVLVTATFSTTSENYNVPDAMTAYVTILKKTVGVSWTGITTTYDGELHLPEAKATGLIDGDTCTLTVTGAKTAAGTHTATLTAISNENYALPEEVTKTFTISKAEYDMTNITFSDATLTYNGEAQHQEIQGTFPEGVDGSVPSVSGYTGSATNVSDGEVTITVSFESGSDNYNAPKDMTATLSITPAVLEIEWGIDDSTKDSSATYSRTYDTFSHQIQVSVVSGLINEDTCEITAPDTFKTVGTYVIDFTFSNSNYTAATTEVTVTISKLYIYYINFWSYGYIGLYGDTTITGGEDKDITTVFEDMKYTYYDYSTKELVGDTLPVTPGTYYTILVSDNSNVTINCSVQSDSFKITVSAAYIDEELDSLPEASEVTIDDIADIRTLKSNYSNLTENEKAEVENVTKLNELLAILDNEIYWSGNSSTGSSNAVFTVTSGRTGSSSMNSITYAGLTLSSYLKLETSTKISFTTSETKTLMLVLGKASTVKLDGTSYTGTEVDGYYVVTITVEAGTHSITKADSANLYYMILM